MLMLRSQALREGTCSGHSLREAVIVGFRWLFCFSFLFVCFLVLGIKPSAHLPIDLWLLPQDLDVFFKCILQSNPHKKET